MNDDTIYVWAVKDEIDRIHHICTKRSTADYLRDWCEAKLINEWMDTFVKFNCPPQLDIYEESVKIVANKFTVIEEEVV